MNLDTITVSEVLSYVKSLPDESVNCSVSSPPYYRQRDYKVDGQIGWEDAPQAFINKLVDVYREIRRVLRKDGTCWINMGDTYTGSGKGPPGKGSFQKKPGHINGVARTSFGGLPRKSLMMMPARLAIALQDDGWVLRSDIIWFKPNPMPSSVQDRPSPTHEHIFLLSKAVRYWYDADAVREPAQDWGTRDRSNMRDGTTDPMLKHGGLTDGNFADRGRNMRNVWVEPEDEIKQGKNEQSGNRLRDGFNARWDAQAEHSDMRNLRDVWEMAAEPNPEPHYATFPQKLAERCILAGCPERVCAVCGKPYKRESEKTFVPQADVSAERGSYRGKVADESHWEGYPRGTVSIARGPLVAGCECAGEVRGGVVLDPFMGSGTTALVARRLNRHYIGCDLSPFYVSIAERRLKESDPFQNHTASDGTVQYSLFNMEDNQ